MNRAYRSKVPLAGWFAGFALFAVGALVCASPARGADDAALFKNLFNGKDLSGWDGNPKFWSVKDGTITGQTTSDNPTQGNTFLIWREGTLDDFEPATPLSFEALTAAGLAALWGWAATHLCAWPFRRSRLRTRGSAEA